MPKEYARKLRVNTQLQRELTDLIRELTDPRVARVTVTSVDVAPDLRQAKVYISLLALDANPDEAVKALNGAAPKLRFGLGRRMRLRYVPQLHFQADRALIQGDRVGGLIRKAVKEDESYAQGRGDTRGDTDLES